MTGNAGTEDVSPEEWERELGRYLEWIDSSKGLAPLKTLPTCKRHHRVLDRQGLCPESGVAPQEEK